MAQVFTTVICIRMHDKSVRFYSAVAGDKGSIQMESKPFKAKPFTDEFYREFGKFLTDYSTAKPSYAGKAAKVTILVPDCLVLTDSVNIPGVNRKSLDNMTTVAIEARYRNLAELRYNKYVSASNKQYSTVNMVVVRQKLLQGLYTCCSAANMFANVLTFESNAIVDGAMALNGKLKGGTYLLADIKEGYSRLAYVVKGNTVGCFDLPFGFGILHDNKLVAENMLFDHPTAELAVVNAKEKAKAKQLTMAGGDAAAENPEGAEPQEADNFDAEISFSNESNTVQRTVQIKTLPKKTPRVLPKFMQRPIPETPEGYQYENFRIFVKWILEFIGGNPRLKEMGTVETVYVNMPPRFDHLYDAVNLEKEENGVVFQSLGLDKEKDIIARHLELYGGLFAAQYNQNNNF